MAALKWTEATLAEEARKYTTRKAFRDGSNGAYQVARNKGFLDEICAHMTPVLTYWTDDMLRAEAQRYTSRIDFRKKGYKAYDAARSRGLLNDICAHMQRPPSDAYWTAERIAEEALKYSTRSAFAAGSGVAYTTANRKGILDVVCAHMVSPNMEWPIDILRTEAKKYTTRAEFARNSKRAYAASKKRGVFEEICAHMDDGYTGFKAQSPAILYYLRVEAPTPVYKIGITNRSVKERYTTDMASISVLKEWHFEIGANARKREQAIVKEFSEFAYDGLPPLKYVGVAEMFTKDVLGLDKAA